MNAIEIVLKTQKHNSAVKRETQNKLKWKAQRDLQGRGLDKHQSQD